MIICVTINRPQTDLLICKAQTVCICDEPSSETHMMQNQSKIYIRTVHNIGVLNVLMIGVTSCFYFNFYRCLYVAQQ